MKYESTNLESNFSDKKGMERGTISCSLWKVYSFLILHRSYVDRSGTSGTRGSSGTRDSSGTRGSSGTISSGTISTGSGTRRS